jgi:hypothetical protein
VVQAHDLARLEGVPRSATGWAVNDAQLVALGPDPFEHAGQS